MFKSCIPTQDHITRPKLCPSLCRATVITASLGAKLAKMPSWCGAAWHGDLGPLALTSLNQTSTLGVPRACRTASKMTGWRTNLADWGLTPSPRLAKCESHRWSKKTCVFSAFKKLHNPFLLILNVPLILKTCIHLQFPKISVWPIWLLIDPL